jgi:NDP-sugar pyrophosphorylase family protein
MNRIRHAIIMAAGRGRRMMPLTAAMPKAMAPYRDSTLIAESIVNIRRHIPFIHITVGYKGAMLAQHVIEHGVSSIFNTEGKSNCWWIYNTILKHLEEPMIVLTCDNVIELDFELLEKDYFYYGEPACMVVPVRPVHGLDGDYIFHRENIVTELNRQKQSDIYCSGIQVINPVKINSMTVEGADFYSTWNQLIPLRQLIASRIYPDRWYTVDTLTQLTEISMKPGNEYHEKQ